ncbi:MAG: hypothetical protein WC869_16195 [Phycisphaerae bacterium]|jgi:hypothetical protein
MTTTRNTAEYLADLEQWQAYSHPKLANSKLEELLQVPFIERYKSLHSDFWWRIIRVHGTLVTLDQLIQFPFESIYAPNEMEFWRLVFENFVDITVLLLHGLTIDTECKAHTLQSFKKEIIEDKWLRSDKFELFRQTLRERKFGKRVKSIKKCVTEMRNNYIAHRSKDEQSGLPKEGLAGVTLEELWVLFDEVHSLFGALSFGSAYVTLAGDLMPSTVGGEPTRTCLDGLLDAVLRDSLFVNEPERKEKLWPGRRKHRKPESLRVMNELRKRIGLPEA